jgi:hypothetical protein
MPEVCCAYSTLFQSNEQVSKFWTALGRLWTMRWLLFAKALRAGYNVLNVDNDVMFATDIYRCVRRPTCMPYIHADTH